MIKTNLFFVAFGLFLTSLVAVAHHSFAAEFDSTKPVTLQGTITKVEWMNPHSWLYLDAKESNGLMTKWQCELASPNQLQRRGWSRNTVKAGDQLIVSGFRAKNGTNTCNAAVVKTPEGQQLFGNEGPAK